MTTHMKPVVVMVPGDLHLTGPDQDNVAIAHRVVDQANDVVRPDFVQFIGDNVQDALPEQFRLLDSIRGRLSVPHYCLAGDHDVKDDPTAGRFRRALGEVWGSTSIRGFRFIRLATQEARPVGFSSEQLAWLADQFEIAASANERVVVFQHHYPYQIWEDFNGPGVDVWRAIVRRRRIEAIICGHTHYWQVANDGWNVMVAVRSIGDPEGGPPGYGLFYFHGDDLAASYRPVEDTSPIVLIVHPRDRLLAHAGRHVVKGEDQVVVKTFSIVEVSRVEGRIDGGSWFNLEPTGDDHWSGPIPGDKLDKGEHLLEARARDRDDAIGIGRIEFLVDHTGRFTAVPEARPRVTSTAFC